MTIDIHDMEERSFFRKLIIRGNKLGLRVFVFTPRDVYAQSGRIRAYEYDAPSGKWVRGWTTYPTLIYDRCRYKVTTAEEYRRFKQFREANPNLIYLSRPITHKWGMHQFLEKSDRIRSYLPETRVYRDQNVLLDSLRSHPLIYLKPITGTGGRGILRIERRRNDRLLVQGRQWNRRIISPKIVAERSLPNVLTGWKLKDRYLVQQGIRNKLPDGRVFDFRLLIQKNGGGEWDVTGCAGRIGPRQSITSNLHGGGEAVPMTELLGRVFESEEKVESIRNEMYDLGYAVAQSVEDHFGQLCELGIDIAVDPNGHPWLLELNPKPAREVFARIGEQVTYEKAISRPLEYAKWLFEQRRLAKAKTQKKRRKPIVYRAGRRLPRP